MLFYKITKTCGSICACRYLPAVWREYPWVNVGITMVRSLPRVCYFKAYRLVRYTTTRIAKTWVFFGILI